VIRKVYPNLIYFHEAGRGGHFAAWEEPDLFAAEIRAHSDHSASARNDGPGHRPGCSRARPGAPDAILDTRVRSHGLAHRHTAR